MSNLKKWGSYDPKAAEAEADVLDKLSSGDFMKLRVGRNVVRVLPPLEGQATPFVMTFQHFIELPGMAQKVVFNCPRRMANQPCPACRKADDLRATGNPLDYDLAKQFTSRPRVYVAVIDRDDEDAGPKILAVGKTIYEDLIDLRNDPDGGDYTNPANGYDVVIRRQGTGKEDTKYKVSLARDESQVGTEEQMDQWLEMMPDLRTRALVPSARDIRKQLLGAGADEDDIGVLPAAGEDVTGGRRKRTTRRRTAESDLQNEVE